MIASFDQPLPGAELDRYLADIQQALKDTGLGIGEVIERWQSRYSYKVGWASHEPTP